jgi:hypothetical protein
LKGKIMKMTAILSGLAISLATIGASAFQVECYLPAAPWQASVNVAGNGDGQTSTMSVSYSYQGQHRGDLSGTVYNNDLNLSQDSRRAILSLDYRSLSLYGVSQNPFEMICN